MTIDLVKEYSKLGEVSYHVEVDGQYQSGTAKFTLAEAQEVFENLRSNLTQARKEVLIREEL